MNEERKLIEEARAPEGLTLAECFEWMRRYRSEPFSTLSLATTAAKDHSPLRVMASLGWHAKNRANALEAALAREQRKDEAIRPYLRQHNLAARDRYCVCSYCNGARQALAAVPVETQEAAEQTEAT